MRSQFLSQTFSASTQVFTNLELLKIIISHIEYDDVKSLYSFSLVNKSWCKIGIPYLWKSPLSLKLTYINNHIKIIPIYISCLDKKAKLNLSQILKNDFIKRENILIESIHNSNSNSNSNNNNNNNNNNNDKLSEISENLRNLRNSFINLLRSNYLSTKSSSFNYLKFINEIDLYNLYKLIFEWLANLYSNVIIKYIINDTNSLINSINANIKNLNSNDEIFHDQTRILTQEFFNLFINNSNHLQHLKFEDHYNSPLTLIQSFLTDNNNDRQKLKSQLSKIESLHLQLNNIFPDLISKFITYKSYQLHTISLSSKYEEVPPDFSSLIEKQEGLKILFLKQVIIDTPTFGSINSQYSPLGNLSLINVIINSSNSLKKLSKCINLHTLRIEFDKKIPETYNNLSKLWNLHFPLLNKLIIIGSISKNDLENHSFEDNILGFFRNNSNSIKELKLNLNSKIYSRILPRIGEDFINLKKLTINNFKHNLNCDDYLFKIFKSSEMKLEKLKVLTKYCDYSTNSHSPNSHSPNSHSPNSYSPNSYSPNSNLLEEIRLPRLSELKGLRYLKHLDLGMEFSSTQISHLLDRWHKVPLIHLNYLCKDDVSDHHSTLIRFSRSLNQERQGRICQVDIKDSFVWFENSTYRIDLDLYHCI
ncbi:hypothetical protein Glove_299g96 [Diversispora epigaea]|uniref:F-box domain-containing protein n=1 Tax=Diversispora epigaea TaxID=1348612 RepID=A0A397I1Y0_9GLOM|nr:hypothetical protein Glove_299g96 [Diversispora epigaea]